MNIKISRLCLLLACMVTFGCSTNKSIDWNLLKGHWIALDSPRRYPDIILTSNEYTLVLDRLDSTSNIGMWYTLKGSKIILFSKAGWISKSDVTKLDKDSMSFVRRGDKQVFKFFRKTTNE